MTSLHRLFTGAVLVAASTTISACRHKPEPQAEPAPIASAPGPQPEPTPAPPATVSASTPTQPSNDEAESRKRALLATPVHFDFDRYDLDVESRANLDAKLEVLLADRALRLRVEGHADDRGSDEYNLALGQRRAAAVRRYFGQHDVGSDRVEIVSLGEERPTCAQANETCRHANRRAEFVVMVP